MDVELLLWARTGRGRELVEADDLKRVFSVPSNFDRVASNFSLRSLL